MTLIYRFVDWQIPGVPIMYITQHKYSIERLPEATIGGGRLDGASIKSYF